jgi:hypothetical protein
VKLLSVVHEWWAGQENPAERVRLARLVTGAAVLRATWHLPPGSFIGRESVILRQADTAAGSRGRLSPVQYQALRWMSLASVAAWTLGCDRGAVRITANTATLLVHRENVKVYPPSWNYSTHLHAYLAFLSAHSGGELEEAEAASRTLALMQLGYAWIYLQAGVSKLRNTGLTWVNGATLRGSWAECGTPLGKRASRLDGKVAAAASLAAVAFELGFLPATILLHRHRSLLGLASLAFHAIVKATLGISFWHQHWLALPLFLFPGLPGCRQARPGGTVADRLDLAGSDRVNLRLLP